MEEIYKNITMEFIATFKTRYPICYDMDNFVSFFFNGEYFDLIMKEFIRLLRLHDEEYLDSNETKELKTD